MAGQVLPEVEEEGRHVVRAGRIARPQPELRDQPHLGPHRHERMQTWLETLPRVTHGDAMLMAVLMQEPGGVEIERVTFFAAGQPHHAPLPEPAKAAQMDRRGVETRKKPRERRLAGHPPDAEQLRHQRITPADKPRA